MAVFRFRVTFEEHYEVVREIDVKSSISFLDFHKAIHIVTGYDAEKSSSFYVSNDQWNKGKEIAYLPSERKLNKGVALMEDLPLSQFIDDPHQKFYYTYNFDNSIDFQIELIKILDEQKGVQYPLVSKSEGEIPKLVAVALAQTVSDDDFQDMSDDDIEKMFNPEEMESEEDIAEMSDMGINMEEEEEEEDDFIEEFSDQEGAEDEGSSYENGDDY